MSYLTRQQALDIINKAPSNLNREKLLYELGKTNTIEGYNEPAQKSNLIKDIGREIAKPFAQGAELLSSGARAYGGVIKAGVQSATGRKEESQKTLQETAKKIEERKDLKILGQDVNKITTGKQAVGTALNLASNLVGGGGAIKAGAGLLKSQLGRVAVQGAKTGAKAGALYGAGEAVSEDKNVLGGTALGALGGAVGGAVLPVAAKGVIGTAKVLTSPFSTAIEKVVPQLNKIANKVETVVTKPSKTDLQHGFKVENIFKYDLGGPLGQSLQKTEAKISELVARAENLRGNSKAVIDLNKIVQDVAKDLDTASISNVGNNQKILNAFKTWITELEGIAPTGKINTVDAQKIKVALGKMGSWLNGQRDLDSTAMENVSNVLYTRMKTAIENAVDDPKELKEINRQLSEVIPINSVLIKRIPIADRNSSISLTDIISASAGTIDPKAWGIFAINRLSKSARFANLVNKASDKLKSGATKLLPLEEKLKNLKPGMTIEDVSKLPKGKGEILKSKAQPLNSLVEEAKKFKSAEEFVKAQATKDGVATRFGEISKDGAYFSKQVNGFENKNYFNAKTGNIKNSQYDISKANIVESDTKEALTVLQEALKDKSNTPQDIIRLKREISAANEYGGKAVIDWRMNDEIPSIVKSAKKLGYDGINVIETGDVSNPTSLFIWNTNKIKELQTKQHLTDIWKKSQKLK